MPVSPPRIPSFPSAAVFSLLVLTFGCGDAPAPVGFSVDTLPDGRIVVENGGDGVWADGEKWTVEERFRLGSEEADSPELFSSISDLELDPMGRLWLIEQQDQEIRVFGPEGSHVRTFGRRGEGPGEFANVSGLVWGPEGNLWTIDQRQGRLSVFDTAGVYLDGRRMEGFYQVFPWPGGTDNEGFLYDVRSSMDPETRNYLIRFDSLLSPIDTVLIPEHPEGKKVFTDSGEGSYTTVTVPFSGSGHWVLKPDGGFWVLVTDRYELFRVDWPADTVLVSRKAFEPIPVTREEIDESLRGLSWFEGEVDAGRIPDTKPPVRLGFIDDEGNLWVIPLLVGELENRVADVFDPDGVFLGSVDLPAPINTHQVVVRNNTLVAVSRDSLFVPSVVAMSIRKPVSR